MKTIWRYCVLGLVVIVALVTAAEIVRSVCDSFFAGGRITVTGGTLDSKAIDPSNPRVVIAPGATLSGSVDIQVENNGAPGDNFPVCVTPSWGDHSSSGWMVNPHQPPGVSSYAVPISLTVPSTPGMYYILFAASWEPTFLHVLSCTNWTTLGGPVFNNGFDVADWSDDQVEDAVYRGWVCSKWLVSGLLEDIDVPAAAVRILALSGSCDPSYSGGSIVVTGGTLNSQTLDPDDPQIEVRPDVTLDGTVNIQVQNNGAMGDVFPVCATPNWGDHQTSGWTIDTHCPPGTANYAVPISVTVPSTPGMYYLFFVGAWELDCGNVLSCTNWADASGDIWNDGHDVADWSTYQAETAIDYGWVCTTWVKGGSLIEIPVPGAAVTVRIPSSSPVEATNWGKIKMLYE